MNKATEPICFGVNIMSMPYDLSSYLEEIETYLMQQYTELNQESPTLDISDLEQAIICIRHLQGIPAIIKDYWEIVEG
jgi:hypothetical protein